MDGVKLDYTMFDENIAANGGPGDWLGVNPFDPNYRVNPYPGINALREADPVNLTPVNTWRINRFDDIQTVLRSAKTSQTLANGLSPGFDPLDKRGSFLEFVLNKDGEEHARLRQMIVRSLNMKTVRAMEGSVIETVDEVMKKALADGGLDIIKDLAMVVPSRMVCAIMGIPEEDREMFDRLTALRTNGFFGRFLPLEVQQQLRQAGIDIADYFEKLVAKRRKSLGDDLVSQLIISADQDGIIPDEQLAVQAIGVIVAGFETTIGLIGNGCRALIEHPDQLALFREDTSRVNAVIDEGLRYDAPIHFIWRVLTEPLQLGEKLLPKDAVLWLHMASGNHDPLRFDDPEKFNIQRERNTNVSFGGGAHFCLGNQLARMEARHSFTQLAERTKNLKINPGEIVWSPSFFRVMGNYPVTFS
ncbi:Cytochrome P450 monooxygenase PikC [Zhongshania aliphaticivorans]|uniref:Cytochrome P450 monooxygenase PikC n=1 Tax=Zhongshania aliphaticivorans TaxID=1470434 RepID=A0A5S9QJS7_9GAMM|nr:cytochrome P450 [Zhongshania aliphaticivorans]CAA0111152.1 Cytochrome P450 monooxygenase PikC [Zhongshania aliphaticivorans]CAA0118478.1 Cytochrome P450 monooxygenase PikC [Zhongshania aliphaticivorans]